MLPEAIFILAFLTPIECARKKVAVLKFNNMSSDYNPKNSDFFSFSISPNTNGRMFDLTWNLTRNIKDQMILHLEVFLKTGNSYTIIFPYEFDLCRVWDGFMGGTFARIWLNNLRRYGKFPTTCPISKGYYFLKKMQMRKGSIPKVVQGGVFLAKGTMFTYENSIKDILFNMTSEIEIVKA